MHFASANYYLKNSTECYVSSLTCTASELDFPYSNVNFEPELFKYSEIYLSAHFDSKNGSFYCGLIFFLILIRFLRGIRKIKFIFVVIFHTLSENFVKYILKI